MQDTYFGTRLYDLEIESLVYTWVQAAIDTASLYGYYKYTTKGYAA